MSKIEEHSEVELSVTAMIQTGTLRWASARGWTSCINFAIGNNTKNNNSQTHSNVIGTHCGNTAYTLGKNAPETSQDTLGIAVISSKSLPASSGSILGEGI